MSQKTAQDLKESRSAETIDLNVTKDQLKRYTWVLGNNLKGLVDCFEKFENFLCAKDIDTQS